MAIHTTEKLPMNHAVDSRKKIILNVGPDGLAMGFLDLTGPDMRFHGVSSNGTVKIPEIGRVDFDIFPPVKLITTP